MYHSNNKRFSFILKILYSDPDPNQILIHIWITEEGSRIQMDNNDCGRDPEQLKDPVYHYRSRKDLNWTHF